MLTFLSKNWWILVLRGVAAIAFGIITFMQPVLSLKVLVLFWGAYALVDGVFAVFAAFKGPNAEGFPWWMLLTGLCGIAAGVFTFMSPLITALALLYLIAIFAIVRGVLEISAAIRLRKQINNEWLLILAGVISILFGAVLMVAPGTGAIAIALWIAAFAVIVGVIEIILGFKLKGRADKLAPA